MSRTNDFADHRTNKKYRLKANERQMTFVLNRSNATNSFRFDFCDSMNTMIFFPLLFLFSSSIFVNAEDFYFVFPPTELSDFQNHLFDFVSNSTKISAVFDHFQRVVQLEINDTTTSNCRLNIDRADLIENDEFRLVFLVIRQNFHVETFVNCRKIDSISLKFVLTDFHYENLNSKVEFERISSTNRTALVEFFDSKGCKTSDLIFNESNDSILSLSKKLSRQIENFIEKNQENSPERLTIVFQPNREITTTTIIENPSFNFSIVFYPNESLVELNFDATKSNQNFLFVGKSADRLDALKNRNLIFIELSRTTTSSFVNCERTDRDFLVESIDVKNFFNSTKFIFDRRSTLIFFNKTFLNSFCSKIDETNLENLPEKLRLRKLSKNFDIFSTIFDEKDRKNVSLVEIAPINTFGSLKSSLTTTNDDIFCSTDADCHHLNDSPMICQSNRCVCRENELKSTSRNRCFVCHDLIVGRRCFRFSSHKSNWIEAKTFCENSDENDFQLTFATNFNRSEIETLKNSFRDENADYSYWIGETTNEFQRRIRFPNLWCSNSFEIENERKTSLCVGIAACGLFLDDCQRHFRYICEAI